MGDNATGKPSSLPVTVRRTFRDRPWDTPGRRRALLRVLLQRLGRLVQRVLDEPRLSGSLFSVSSATSAAFGVGEEAGRPDGLQPDPRVLVGRSFLSRSRASGTRSRQ